MAFLKPENKRSQRLIFDKAPERLRRQTNFVLLRSGFPLFLYLLVVLVSFNPRYYVLRPDVVVFIQSQHRDDYIWMDGSGDLVPPDATRLVNSLSLHEMSSVLVATKVIALAS